MLAGTGSDALSDERKWQIRMLLPRSDALKTLAPAAAAAAAPPTSAVPAATSAAQLFGGVPLELLQALQLQQVHPRAPARRAGLRAGPCVLFTFKRFVCLLGCIEAGLQADCSVLVRATHAWVCTSACRQVITRPGCMV